MTLPSDHPVSRDVPTLIYNSRAWVPATAYDELYAALERIANYPATVSYPEKWVHWADQARQALEADRAV